MGRDWDDSSGDSIPRKSGFGRLGDGLSGLGDDGVEYLKLRWTSLRLKAVDTLSDSLSGAFGFVLALAVVLVALTFLAIALALWIGEMIGHLSLGFLISGGGFLICGVVLFFVGRKLVENSLVRHFIDVFFTDNDYGDDSQE
ncbi:MAG: phage holin family protein [Alistipes sp.]|jgi:hypothetical protein|nr:phage holin family protein [Alistipes sp.]